MEELSEVEKQMKAIIYSYDKVEQVICQLNGLIASLEWPLESGEQGRTFQDIFKKNGFEWFKLLCDKLTGVEKGDRVWRDFDFAGSWLDLASDHQVGVGITKELVELLHPHGRFMTYLHHLSDVKKVTEHWAQVCRGQDPDTPSGNYVAFPFSFFPTSTQHSWYKNWRQALVGAVPPTTSRHAPTTPFYYQPNWCPISRDIPFHTQNGTITEVLVTPFSYFMLRYGIFLYKRIEINSSTDFIPKNDVLDSVVSQGSRLRRGAAVLSSITKKLRKEEHERDGAEETRTQREFKLTSTADIIPGYCTLFDLFQTHYVPAPGQPFLQPFVSAKYQKMLTYILNQDVGYRIETIPHYCGAQFVTILSEVWPRGMVDLWNLVQNPPPEPPKVKGPEGVPSSLNVKEDLAAEDLRCRAIILVQPLTALMKAVQYHEYLRTMTAVPAFNKHCGARTTALQKLILPPTTCRDFRASTIQLIHLILSMANGTCGDQTRFGSSRLVPLLETMSLWTSVLSPYRVAAVRLQEVSDDKSETVVTPVAGRGYTPYLWWLNVPDGQQRPTELQSPAARFVRSFIEVIDALATVANVELLACLPRKGSVLLRDVAWVRCHHKELSMLINQVSQDTELQAKANTAVQSVAALCNLPLPPAGCGLALLHDAEMILCGGPFLADWEVEDQSNIGMKPTLLKRPFCLRTLEFFSSFTKGASYALTYFDYIRASTLNFLSIANNITTSIKPGPLPLEYASSAMWRETRELLKMMMHNQLPQREVVWRHYVKENQEAYVVLFCDLVDYMQSEFVRNDNACTEAVLLSFYRILTCITDPTVRAEDPYAPRGFQGQPGQQQAAAYFLPAETWPTSAHGFKHYETKISRLVMDLRWRMERTQEGADVSPVPVLLYEEIIVMLMMLVPAVHQRVEEMEKAEKLGEPYVSDSNTATGQHSRLQYQTDYDNGYQLNESGRHKVLSTGTPFEFKDMRQKGGNFIELNGPESAWRHLASKLPADLRRRYFPYKRPPSSNEVKWVLKITKKLDTLVFTTLDSLHAQGLIGKVLDIAWVNEATGELLPEEISSLIEQGQTAASGGKSGKTLKIQQEEGVTEVDLRQRWVRPAEGAGYMVSRKILDPPSTRPIAKDSIFTFASFLVFYLYFYYTWILYLCGAVCTGCYAVASQRRMVVPATPM
eukprot:TRINITY_DN22845_c0_g1_i1.p1 TRINITY_DN22845_c0_g1~~TRINITY_DN22845_c0_g1_i1.p1  ORF type:complete len:1171 (+),score=264.60 TRINITY_DN22845_c0_g1_i1:54-3566(+)